MTQRIWLFGSKYNKHKQNIFEITTIHPLRHRHIVHYLFVDKKKNINTKNDTTTVTPKNVKKSAKTGVSALK